MSSTLQVRRLAYALGAEVRGVDLKGALADETIAAIRTAWLDHLVLCFPGQDLTKDEMAAFAGRFGDVDSKRFAKNRDPEHSSVTLVTNKPVGGQPFDGYKGGQSWHSDRSYMVDPALGTFLHAKELPPVGGNTLFANQYMAYETLSPALQRILEGLCAVHDNRLVKNRQIQAPELLAQFEKLNPPAVHPVVKVHPETNRKSLFLGERVRQFEGLTEDESRPLLDFLNRHATSYEFTYRHVWSANDLVMWDNRCMMHLAPTDYDLWKDVRHMWRCTLHGTTRGRLWDPHAQETAPAADAAREAVGSPN